MIPRVCGFVVLGAEGGRALVEEVVATGAPDPMDEALLRRLWQFLVELHRAARQESVIVRTHEANPAALALVRQQGLGLLNALRTVVRATRLRPADPPTGYAVRKAEARDAAEIARLHEEAYGERLADREVAARIGKPYTRTFVCERGGVAVGYAHAVSRSGTGDLWVTVRETHRRRGVGSALGSAAAAFLYTKEHPARFNHWGLDVAAGPWRASWGLPPSESTCTSSGPSEGRTTGSQKDPEKRSPNDSPWKYPRTWGFRVWVHMFASWVLCSWQPSWPLPAGAGVG